MPSLQSAVVSLDMIMNWDVGHVPCLKEMPVGNGLNGSQGVC